MTKIAYWWALPINSKRYLLNIIQRSAFLAIVGFVLSVGLSPSALGQTPARAIPRGNAGLQNSPYSTAVSTVATTTSMAVLDDSRKLGIGDQVSFRVVEDRDPPVGLIVTDSGEMEVPYIGRVKAAGRTCKQLALSIKSALEVDYYYSATVIVGLDSANTTSRGRVYVSGEVLNQGAQEIPANEEFTASKALTNSGGFTKFANKNKVRIIRKNPNDPNGSPEILIFDYEKFQAGKGSDIPLQANDTINVRARAIVFGGG